MVKTEKENQKDTKKSKPTHKNHPQQRKTEGAHTTHKKIKSPDTGKLNGKPPNTTTDAKWQTGTMEDKKREETSVGMKPPQAL